MFIICKLFIFLYMLLVLSLLKNRVYNVILYFGQYHTKNLFHFVYFSKEYLTILVAEFWTMHGRDTTAPCLPMVRQGQESLIPWWVTGPTRVLCRFSVMRYLKVLMRNVKLLEKMKTIRYIYI